MSVSLQPRLAKYKLYPQSAVAWTAVYAGALWIALYLLRKIAGTAVSSIELAFSFTTFILAGALLLLGYRWLKQKFMWRLRNRLIVTYVFIGVIPLVLVITMGLLAAYLFAGQFSSFVMTNDLQSEIKRIAVLNQLSANHVAAELKKGAELTAKLAPETDSGARQIVAYYRGKAVVLQPGEDPEAKVPRSAPAPEIDAIALDDDKLYLRSAVTVKTGRGGDEPMTVLSSLPLTKERLGHITSELGLISVYTRSSLVERPEQGGVRLKVGDTEEFLDRRVKVSAGRKPDPAYFLDVDLPSFAALQNAIDWQTGKPSTVVMTLETRPSMLYSRLFRTLGDTANVIVVLLVAVAIFFALIELVALVVGIRLTRTMTKSVASLYDATQHVNQGDFSHRIKVTSRDQLAALETSFNSMTSSLEKLIAEQKEKQRIESELAIAQEVQALLFPRDITELEGLAVHGVCRPARTVSGDYYDFLPVGPTRLGIAVGDISGKGISAALLMATVHAFVRAYTLMEHAPVAAGAAALSVRESASLLAGRNGFLPPGTLLSMLNQQLYRSTPTEKYATMFLGFYDQTTREFTYSNAGHLPPLIVSANGSVRELETGGTVVGLFGDMTYPDAAVRMQPGDIFVAYSDGVTEPENEFGEFGTERLAQIIQENRDESLQRITDTVMTAVQDWIGSNEQPDDVTLVLARAR
ncbi:MAG TPA: SpoIIE family protein phosphatase [Clostridia bacterium]|nr:SpoIIE family protein phosphatase [Clostridia bacterium]